MKLICIKQESYDGVTGDKINNPILIVGNEYTIEDIVERQDKGVYYRLRETRWLEVFHSSLFAVISDIDETELVNERELVEA